MLTVHLIVNVYNGEKYLAETLESLVRQDYPHYYIHCFNNHSTDNTADIIDTFKFKHENIRSYLTPVHMPLVEARNHAISKLKSFQENVFYFGFCDADDLWELNWLSSLMKFSEYNYDVLICDGYLMKEKQNEHVSSCLSLSRPSPFSCPVFIQSCVFSSNIIKSDQLLFDNRFRIIFEIEMWWRIGRKFKYLHVSDRLFYYRIHSGSACKNNFFPILYERWRMLRLHKLPKSYFLYGLFRYVFSIVSSGKY